MKISAVAPFSILTVLGIASADIEGAGLRGSVADDDSPTFSPAPSVISMMWTKDTNSLVITKAPYPSKSPRTTKSKASKTSKLSSSDEVSSFGVSNPTRELQKLEDKGGKSTKAPNFPVTPNFAKASKAPNVLNSSKAPKVFKAFKAPKEPKASKAPKTLKASKTPKYPRTPITKAPKYYKLSRDNDDTSPNISNRDRMLQREDKAAKSTKAPTSNASSKAPKASKPPKTYKAPHTSTTKAPKYYKSSRANYDTGTSTSNRNRVHHREEKALKSIKTPTSNAIIKAPKVSKVFKKNKESKSPRAMNTKAPVSHMHLEAKGSKAPHVEMAKSPKSY